MNDNAKGSFDRFYVKYNGSLYQRDALICVGEVLEAFEHEEDERQELLPIDYSLEEDL